ncbi:LytR C-terminal domain-containing protein [Streptomyces ziwulingensis]
MVGRASIRWSPGKRAAEELRGAGFTVIGTGNAEATSSTTVRYPADLEQQAELLASRTPGARSQRDEEAAPGPVTLVVGTGLDPERIR